MKTYEITLCNETHIVEIRKEKYLNNSRLAVQLVTVPDNELFAVITTNIAFPLSGDINTHAFIDTNNCGFWGVEKFLQENEIAKPTYYCGTSGYCVYPEYQFDLSKLVGGK